MAREPGSGDVRFPLRRPSDSGDDSSLPPVSPVSFEVRLSCVADTVVLSGGDVAFLPGSAEFKDAEAARSLVGPIAEQLISGQASARLTGTTADVGDDGEDAGQQRAAQARRGTAPRP